MQTVDASNAAAELKLRNDLALLISRFAPHDGLFEVCAGVRLLRESSEDARPARNISQPGMCIVAQGAKRVVLGDSVFEYDNSRMVVYSTEVPISASIIRASENEPYLCLIIDIAPNKLAELSARAFPNGQPRVQQSKAIHIGPANPKIIEAGIRLLTLCSEPGDTDLLISLVLDEIFIRLLQSDIGALVAQIGIADSNLQKVSHAISWVREHYAQPMKIDRLAARVNMSVSSFHQHFKAVTAMSPLQFQKELRLHEAKNLMLSNTMDVSAVSMQVGYASVSQFSREYSRLFGVSPSKDIRPAVHQAEADNVTHLI
ncbi:MAG: AraC family transcriptional regulator [Methylophaga sp.]